MSIFNCLFIFSLKLGENILFFSLFTNTKRVIVILYTHQFIVSPQFFTLFLFSFSHGHTFINLQPTSQLTFSHRLGHWQQ